MRKLVGIVIIAFSLLFGLGCAIAFHQEIIVSSILFWIISLPLYILGQIIRTSKAQFKYEGKRWVSFYLFFFFVYPVLTYFYGYYNDLKENAFIDEKFIIYEPSSGKLGDLSLGTFWFLICLFAVRFLHPDLKRKGLLNAGIIGTIVFLIGFNYFMFSDYRGIHIDKGLVSSNWKYEQQIIAYEEIDRIYLQPDVHYANLSNTSDETRFVWNMTFQPHNQKEVVYYFNWMTEEGLEQTFDMNKIAMENDIPFVIQEMNEETLKWFDFDLELEELEKERYYKLFQVNAN